MERTRYLLLFYACAHNTRVRYRMAEGRHRLLCRPSGAFAIDFLFSCFLSEGPGGGAGRTASSATGGRAVTVIGGGGGVSVCRVFIRVHGIRTRIVRVWTRARTGATVRSVVALTSTSLTRSKRNGASGGFFFN